MNANVIDICNLYDTSNFNLSDPVLLSGQSSFWVCSNNKPFQKNIS